MPENSKALVRFSLLLGCFMISAVQMLASQAITQSGARAQSGIVPGGAIESRIIYNVPPDFSGFKYIRPIEIPSSHTVVDQFIEKNWDAVAAEKVLGKPEEQYAKGVSFQQTGKPGRGDRAAEKIFFLLFNNQYQDEIIDGISIASSKKDVIRKLGAPHFEDNSLQIFGYKGEHFYVFFNGGMRLQTVAVYRRDTNYDKSLIKKVVNNEGAGDLWPEPDRAMSAGVQYRDYISIGIKFASAGVPSHVTVFGNFEGDLTNDLSLPRDYHRIHSLGRDSKEKKLYEDDAIITLKFEPETDLVFDYERGRMNTLQRVKNRTDNAVLLSPDRNKILSYDGCTGGNSSISVFHLDGSCPEIKEYTGFLDYFAWLNDRYIVYLPLNQTIFIFDIINQGAVPLEIISRGTMPLSRNELENYWEVFYKTPQKFKILSSNNRKMIYEISGQGKYEQSYSFDANGRIILSERRKINP